MLRQTNKPIHSSGKPILIFRYVKDILTLWTTIVFLTVDAIAYLLSASSQTVDIPRWGYWVIASVGFVIANIQLYAQREKTISEFQSVKANLVINLLEPSSSYFQRWKGNLGLDQNGMPVAICLAAELEIENLGVEPGTPACEVLLKRSKLPDLFAVEPHCLNGEFYGTSTAEVDGRNSRKVNWQLPLQIVEQSPEAFAQRVRDIQDYKLVMRYKTRRIGGFSRPREIVLNGSFDCLKNALLEEWERNGHLQLCRILKPQEATPGQT